MTLSAEWYHRATAYPYDAPAHSYLWRAGEVLHFDREGTAGRTPVLAFGSNRAPERLAQKFGHLLDQEIPVEQVWLQDFDVVYAAHITRYGAVPAMLQHAPGIRVEIAVTWLNDAQLPIMHQSEMAAANYVFARLDGVTLALANGEVETSVLCYVGSRGHLHNGDGLPLPLAKVRAEGRTRPGETTEAVLRRLQADLDPDLKFRDFLMQLVTSKEYRSSITDALDQRAHAFAYPYVTLTTAADLD